MTGKYNIVFLFSGQGSHYRGMGRRLFETSPVFRNSLMDSDALFRQHFHRSLIAELYHNDQSDFDDLLVTHPAIVAVETAILPVIQGLGLKADYVTGNSLGEFAAAVAAGFWTAEEALEAAIEQAKAIVRRNVEGGMLAVLNAQRAMLGAVYERHGLFLASDNFDGHFTLSGAVENLEAFQVELDGMGVSYLRLPVAHPFHSPLMEKVRTDFAYFMNKEMHTSLELPRFISGLHCEHRKSLPGDYFWQVARQPSDFKNLIHLLERQGPCFYIDLGPSGTGATFVKYILGSSSQSRFAQIMTPFKREPEQLAELKKLQVTH